MKFCHHFCSHFINLILLLISGSIGGVCDFDSLTEEEVAALAKWESFYDNKYIHVGFVVDSEEEKK